MSDFVIAFHDAVADSDLLELLRRPYREHPPLGRSYEYSWGRVAVLEEPHAGASTIHEARGGVLAWVGDLLNAFDGSVVAALQAAMSELAEASGSEPARRPVLELARALNGAFALFHSSERGCSLVGDFSGYTPIYLARDDRERIRACGTHPDVVAVAGLGDPRVDGASLVHFLSHGHTCYPWTMHENVIELPPATLHQLRPGRDPGAWEVQADAYWSLPPEGREGGGEADLAAELRDILLATVRDRCSSGRVAVSLSGGLDSRVVLAAVPRETDCVCVTLLDRANRESATARSVAGAFGRAWLPLQRDAEHLAAQLQATVPLSGCESDWVTAHMIGFGETIRSESIRGVLSGLGFDSYLKGYFARDFTRKNRWLGLRPAAYRRRHYDFVGSLSSFCREEVAPRYRNEALERRAAFFEEFRDEQRASRVEALYWFPFRRRISASWAAERRTLPVRMVAMDKRIVEFAARCPLELRLGGRLFREAACQILGPGRRIPNANDGVRPCSGHASRLLQRLARKASDRFDEALGRPGKRTEVQHSWHDYQRYWRESRQLARLRDTLGPRLEPLSGVVFEGDVVGHLSDPDLFWSTGFRLLQVALWSDGVEDLKGLRAGRA